MTRTSLLFLSIAVGLMRTTSANGETNFEDLLNNNKQCPNFRCTKDFTPVPKKKSLEFTSTGCNTMGSGINVASMGGSGGDDPLGPCCHAWHACYQVCGIGKSICDDDFQACSETVCSNGDKDCEQAASLKKIMIQLNGCSVFDKAQLQACECVAQEKAPARREKAIRSFYQKCAPEHVEKSKDLALKADSAGKLAGMFRKLLKKYPNCIQVAEDPTAKMYENVMKQASQEDENEKHESDDSDEKVEL